MMFKNHLNLNLINKNIIQQLIRNQSTIQIGSKATLSKVFTNEDVQKFADISLDNNELHLDEDAAKKSGFDKQIVHGILVNG